MSSGAYLADIPAVLSNTRPRNTTTTTDHHQDNQFVDHRSSRRLEPRELTAAQLATSSPGETNLSKNALLLKSLNSPNSSSRRRGHHHHSNNNNDISNNNLEDQNNSSSHHRHHSVSPIPSYARHNFQSKLKSNTEPPTPEDDDDVYGISKNNKNNNNDISKYDDDVFDSSNGLNGELPQETEEQELDGVVTTSEDLQKEQHQQPQIFSKSLQQRRKSRQQQQQVALPAAQAKKDSNEQQNTRTTSIQRTRSNTKLTGASNNNRKVSPQSQVASPLRDQQQQQQGGGATSTSTSQPPPSRSHKKGRIIVAVRKRPNDGDGEDCVEINNPKVLVSATKLRVDLTEYTEQHTYEFDHAFHDRNTNAQVYEACARPLLDVVFKGGSASCFAFGQTGSGKTYTMSGEANNPGLYVLAARDVFTRISSSQRVYVALYEIYCNSLFDLLNNRQVVIAREDGNKRVNVCGLTWHEVSSVRELVEVMEKGTDQRRTGSTSANEFSSRSHAIMSLTVRDDQAPKFVGVMNIVDLAGSERAADTSANDRQTRLEGAEINKSLLSLKECIRGLDEKKKHIPFRGSKLTEVLRDSFVGNSKTCMIATISPNPLNAEHTLNTLRYAFRVKGLTVEAMNPSKDRRMQEQQPPAYMLNNRAPLGVPTPIPTGHNQFPGVAQKESKAMQQLGNQSRTDLSFVNDDDTNNNNNNGVDQDGYIRQGNVKRRPHRNDNRTRSQQQVAVAQGKAESPSDQQQQYGNIYAANNNNRMAPLDLRAPPVGGAVGAANLQAMETRMNLQIRELREEVKNLKDTKSKDDVKIAELSAMNRELLTRMDELVKMASSNIMAQQKGGGNSNGAPVQLPPM